MKFFFVVTEDWYFFSHRLPMARAAMRAGFDVSVVTNVAGHAEKIKAEGIRVIPFSFERKSLNPFLAAKQVYALTRLYRAEKPDFVHHIAMKPILYGSIAAAVARVPRVLNAFAGLGFVFSADIKLARFLRPVLLAGFKLFIRRSHCWTLFQNRDDYAVLNGYGVIDPERSAVIRGSGVDLDYYPAMPLPVAPPVVCVFSGRMIDIKGLPTLQAAFAIVEKKMPQIVLWLCGRPDPANPGAWNEARLKKWAHDHPNVVWKGHQSDMSAIWAQAHLCVQPSWGGEGVPKSALEAAASGRAIIATDVPGCREIVDDERNGFLVPPRNADALAKAIMDVASDPMRLAQMGQESRRMVEKDMSAESVSQQTEALYRKIMAGQG